ncbi:hypothetical protein E2562_014431 [Oryza meyeriana var. granulata]|uniref:DUF4378 domain-containing protein n=1 Tax=Oryza meyeriana var. granulata TaxID=110450 RepID=A0A6G1CR87_9ORYZ|nr:hypothetical protein E2562_014431 [Oryza meyeriana var. granulata]
MAEILLHRNVAQPRKQRRSARRIHGNGLEAPRNSLDFPLYDHTMSTMRRKPPKGSTPQDKTTAKDVIHKDFPSQPSVVARLMGIDTIPLPATKDAVMIHAEEISNLKLPSTLEMFSVTSPSSATFRQSKCSLISYHSSSGDYTYRHCLKKMRPRRARSSRQHHPQEKLLEKIREDFQAWQTSKALENARTVAGSECSSKPTEGRYIQMLAQENLHKEKMAKYGYGSCRISMEEKDTLKNVTDNSDTKSATRAAAESNTESGGKVIKVLRVSLCATMPDKFRDSEDEHNSSTSAKPRSQKRIVILKPSSDIGGSDQESLFSSSKVKREDNMEEFLEEVKARLKEELKLKSKSEVIRRSWGTSDPKQIARDIAKQIRETVSMQDLGKRLYSRSESFRAFRSDRKRIAAAAASARNASPEHVRLKSVISRGETKQESNDSSPPIMRSRGRIMSSTDIPLSVSGSGSDDQSCAGECKIAGADVVSPRALVRSFSAPASGISRGRMFAEDDNVGSRRQGNSDAVSEGAAVAASKNSSSSSFSLRGTVSNLRHSLSLRANKLFGKKKTHWSKKPSLGEFHPHKMAIGMLPSPPEIFSPLAVAQENFTELPPSPVSPLEVKGNSSRHFFSDLNCTLPELSPKSWSEFDAPRHSNGSSSCRSNTTATETESYPDMAYIKQVLVAAGLYDDGSSSSSMDKANTRVNSMARPICDYVFHEVEEAYAEDQDAMDHHRMLFDLANEALEILAGSVKPGSSLRRWVVDSTGVSPGRKLLDDVWHQVQALRNPPVQEMPTVESMVAREARKSAWIEVLHEDAYVLGRKVERAIFDELIADIVQEMFFI